MTTKVINSSRYKTEIGEFRVETSGPVVFLCFDCGGGEAMIQKSITLEDAKDLAFALGEAAIWLESRKVK